MTRSCEPDSKESGLPCLAVMLSGSGRTLVNLCEHIERGTLGARIGVIIASRDCLGVARARDRDLPVVIEPGRIERERLGALLDEHAIDWVVLAGYLHLVAIPPGYEGRVVNIHPALLPDFGGPGMFGDRVHSAVLAAGRTESGCSVHLCDERYDRGSIVLQDRCPVLPEDDVESLAARVFALEQRAYPRALQLLLTRGVSTGESCCGRDKPLSDDA